MFIHVFGNHRGRTLLDHDFNVVRTDRFPGQNIHGWVPNRRYWRTIDRAVEAFDRGPRDRWPGTGSGGIRLDENGLLWIRWLTPDPEWTEPEVKPRPGQRPPPLPPLQQVFDNYLDVFDPRTGRTLARHRSDGLIKFVNGYGASSARYVYGVEQNDAGVVCLHLMKAGLERAPASR